MTIYIVGTYQHGSRHRSIISARKKAYSLMKQYDSRTGFATITELKNGLMERWSCGTVHYNQTLYPDKILYTAYDNDISIGTWFLNENGTLGKKISKGYVG